MNTEYVVRYSHVYCDDFEPEYTDTVFKSRDAALAYITSAFDECDDVDMFQRDVVHNEIPF